MKILIIGQGGREHALARAFRHSLSVKEVHVIPGNDGMQKECLCHPQYDLKNSASIVDFCRRTGIEFVFIGPEDPLVAGLGDQLRERGILVVGPNAEGAMLEGSKIYAKEFMAEAKIPTAKYQVVMTVAETLSAAKNFSPPYILKADGLAGGKGVTISKDLKDLQIAAEDLFEKKILGSAGEKAILEQFIPGWELSFFVLTDGKNYRCLPLAQDHKRLKDNNEGPNTGGMGTIAPLHIDQQLNDKIIETIVKPTVGLLDKKNIIYRGIIFIGLMITPEGVPNVIEYNVRFGDPETQVILPLIDGDVGDIFKSVARGELNEVGIKNLYSCCVVLAAEGYPLSPKKNVPIEGNLFLEGPSSYFIHAGTKKLEDGTWVTNGGRVLCSVGLGSSKEEAVSNAYEHANKIRWAGSQMRTDIGNYFDQNE